MKKNFPDIATLIGTCGKKFKAALCSARQPSHAQATLQIFKLPIGVRQDEDSASCFAATLEALYSVLNIDKVVLIEADGIKRWEHFEDQSNSNL